MGHGYIRFAVQHPNHYRLMFMTPMQFDAEMAARDPNKGDLDRDSYALLKKSCQEAIDQRRIRPQYANADVVAQIFWAAVHGVASLHIVKANNPWIEWKGVRVLAEAMVDSILRGVTSDESSERNATGANGDPGGRP
jgi:hypothetical protein